MHILSSFLVLFMLFAIPFSASADALSENIATFVAAGRSLEISRLSPRDIPPATLEYPENGDAFSFNNAEQPIAIFKIGKFNLTTYANTRPSFSFPLGKDATLDIKASRDSVRLQMEMRWK